MKKTYLLLYSILLLHACALAQVSGTKTIGVDYPTLVLAIAALNANGVGSGGAVINVPAWYTETAPAGGFVLGSTTLNASLSATNTLTIKKNGSGAAPVLTAFAGTSSADAIFTLAGVDHVTINGISLQESAANNTATTAMEKGFALLNLNASAPFDGCNEDAIINCAVTLNRDVAVLSYGIYTGHYVAATNFPAAITAISDLHSNNKFYGNTITNVVNGIYMEGYAPGSPTGLFDQNNDIGGNSTATGNSITNFAGLNYSGVGAITATGQNNCNISCNTIDQLANGGVNAAKATWGVYAYGAGASYTISKNTVILGMEAVSTIHYCYGLYANSLNTTVTAADNLIIQSVPAGAGINTAGIYFINAAGIALTGNIILQDEAVDGAMNGIYCSGSGTVAISSNTVTQQTTVPTSNTLYAIASVGNAATETVSNNVLDNISVAGGSSTVIPFFIQNTTGNKTITGNRINGALNINSSSPAYFIYNAAVPAMGAGAVTIANNDLSTINMAGGGALYGIYYAPAVAGAQNININNNNFNAVNNSGGALTGIYLASGSYDSIYNNTFKGLMAAGDITGIYHVAPAANDLKVYNNILSTLSTTGNATATGIDINSGFRVGLFNNFISGLDAPQASAAVMDAVTGMRLTNRDANTSVNVYHNSIYLNAASAGTDFSSSGIYHVADEDPTAFNLKLVNNIIVNTSTPKGAGITAAYHRSGTDLANYDAASNNNDLYAGPPAANRLLFYDGTNADQTLAAYKTRVGPVRDSAAVTVMPVFTSATDLHLTPANNCLLDGIGIAIAGITKDIDGDTRDVGTPDIGADEFTATNSGALAIATVPNSTISVTKNISPSGTLFVAANCDVIARLLPGTLTGAVKVAVVTDPAYATAPFYSFYNAAPYVRRHYDIEPAANAGNATGTVTLYFTDQDFVDYNTYNPLWPKLPTVAGGGNSDPNRTHLYVVQYHGTPLHSPSFPGDYSAGSINFFTTPIVRYNGAYWEVTVSVTSFSGFYIYTGYYVSPLPVTLNYLRGNRQGSAHHISWSVSCISSPVAVMTLERSGDGVHFTAVNTITATALQCLQPFAYDDVQPLSGINYYRLKLADADGRYTYSNIITLVQPVTEIQLAGIAPNPAPGGNFKLSVSSSMQTQMELIITDMQGRVVARRSVALIPGVNSIDMHQGGLVPGMYQLSGTSPAGKTKPLSFITQ